MKKVYLLASILIWSQFIDAQTATDYNLKLKTQLEEVNPLWKSKSLDAININRSIEISNEVSLIQTHLSVVEENLRKKETPNLTIEQKSNRIECLNILNDYWKKGIFPKNLYHSKRTPYFIDNYNTACAVGQLIRETGFDDLAKKIQKESNYDYIKDLVVKYPEIKKWSDNYGFDIDELEWIQPCYCNQIPPGMVNVSCNGGYDGSYSPDLSGINGTPPYAYIGIYKWLNNDWTFLSCGGCNLNAGDYKSVFIDAEGITYEKFATITQPDSLSAVLYSGTNNSNCTGYATADIYGGTGPYFFSWSPSDQITNFATDLCEGMHYVTITDANGCMLVDSIEVSLITGVNIIEEFDYSITPNPSTGQLNVFLNNAYTSNTNISIIDMNGKNLVSKLANSNEVMFDISHLNDGVYFILVSNGKYSLTKKILKIN